MATYTYDPTLATDKDRARYLLGDTGEDSPTNVMLVANEAITGLISRFNFHEAVAQLADGLASRISRDPTWYEDEVGTRNKWEDRVKTLLALSAKMRSSQPLVEAVTTGGSYMTGQRTDPPTPTTSVPGFGVQGIRF